MRLDLNTRRRFRAAEYRRVALRRHDFFRFARVPHLVEAVVESCEKIAVIRIGRTYTFTRRRKQNKTTKYMIMIYHFNRRRDDLYEPRRASFRYENRSIRSVYKQ